MTTQTNTAQTSAVEHPEYRDPSGLVEMLCVAGTALCLVIVVVQHIIGA